MNKGLLESQRNLQGQGSRGGRECATGIDAKSRDRMWGGDVGWGLLSDLGYSLCLGFDPGLLPTATVKEELTGLGVCIMASCRMLGKQRICSRDSG